MKLILDALPFVLSCQGIHIDSSGLASSGHTAGIHQPSQPDKHCSIYFWTPPTLELIRITLQPIYLMLKIVLRLCCVDNIVEDLKVIIVSTATPIKNSCM